MNKILVAVVTHNRLEILKECIDSLFKQEYNEFDILVIDNASTDGTSNYMNMLRSKNVFYQRMPDNIGGAGGFNYAMKYSVEHNYSHTWVMDDDCIADKNALKELMIADEKLKGQYGWLSSKCLWVDGKLCPMNIQRKNPYFDIKKFDQELVETKMASFVSLFVNNSMILKYGLPIKEFFMWGDDWEFTRRISLIENCYVVTKSLVVHKMKTKSTVNIANDSVDRLNRYKFAYRNDVYLYRREGVVGYFWILLKYIWHIIQVIFKSKDNKILKICIIIDGFFDGIKFKPCIEECCSRLEILYYSNNDWNIIKQRQQFLCEGLSDYFDISCIYQHQYRRKDNTVKNETKTRLYEMYVFPKSLAMKYKIFDRINGLIISRKLKKIILEQKIAYMVLSHPCQINYIPNNLKIGLIYDCMDDYSEFSNIINKSNLLKQENKLCNIANIILCSSNELGKRIISRNDILKEKVYVVRNACNSTEIISKHNKNGILKLCYFGAISDWFDFDVIKDSLKQFKNIEYHLIGPINERLRKKNECDRILFYGQVNHDDMISIASNMDCFIMPFKRNSLIEAVDPVKVYEYISLNKNIISIYYPEMEYFSNFVLFYQNNKDYNRLLRKIIDDNSTKYNVDMAIKFLEDNSWKARSKMIRDIIRGKEIV